MSFLIGCIIVGILFLAGSGYMLYLGFSDPNYMWIAAAGAMCAVIGGYLIFFGIKVLSIESKRESDNKSAVT